MVQAIKPVNVRLHERLSFAVSPLGPVGDGGEFLAGVTGDFAPGVAGLNDRAVFGVQQDRERRIHHRSAKERRSCRRTLTGFMAWTIGRPRATTPSALKAETCASGSSVQRRWEICPMAGGW